MDLLVTLDPRLPKRAQVERQLRDAIRSGRLRAGMHLPASRLLATELGVSRGVIVDAYAQLVAEGYLVAKTRGGTRVSDAGKALAETRPEPVSQPAVVRYELRSGVPDPGLFPRQAWSSATSHALRTIPDAALLGVDGGGLPQLRIALADYACRARSAAVTADRTVITAGLAQGLLVLLGVLRDRGVRRVAVEDPSWSHHARAVRLAGLEPVPVPVDERGLVVEQLDRVGADAVIATPAHQFPTGVVLAAERRAALIDWAARRAAFVIEDDYDAEYRYDREPVAALQGMDPDRVIYAGTASKTLAPSLRIGWLMLPGDLAAEVARRVNASGAWPSVIEQAALATLIERGQLERHLRAMRRTYRRRRDAVVNALTQRLHARIGGAAAGLHVVVWLPDGVDSAAIAAQALERGIALDTLHGRCWVRAPVQPALLLGYAATREARLEEAVTELAELPAARSIRK